MIVRLDEGNPPPRLRARMSGATPSTQSAGIRKTAYGRTELFLPSTSNMIRDVKCFGGMQYFDKACVYHMLSQVSAASSVCWHCCEEVAPAAAVPIPRVYDSTQKVFHVFGMTCSPACAKAYLMEHTHFDRGNCMNVLTKMLRDVYGITAPVVACPPRAAMRRFGGHFDPKTVARAVATVVEPPFVSYCMVLEERLAEQHKEAASCSVAPMTVDEEDLIAEPQPPGMYGNFLERMQAEEDERTQNDQGSKAVGKKRVVSRNEGGGQGPLAKFMKKPTT